MEQGVIQTRSKLELSPSGTGMANVKPLVGDDGALHAFTLDKGEGYMRLSVFTSHNGGLDFEPLRELYSLDVAIGDWIWIEATRDNSGNYHFFYMNDAGTFENPIMKERGEGERIMGEEYRGLRINIWHNKCGPDFEGFTEPRMLFEGYVGSLNSCITLKNGRLLLPFTTTIIPMRTWANRGDQVSPYSFFGVSNCVALYSDDEGESFRLSNEVWAPVPDIVSAYGATEPVCFERNDGKVEMIIRTQVGVFYRSLSEDGSHFSTPQPTTIIDSDSPAGITRVGNKTVLLYNSCKRYPYAYGGRHVLHAAISDDDLQTLHGAREVVRDRFNYQPPPGHGDYGTAYSFPCTLPDGRVVFATGQGKDRVSVNILDPAWLMETAYAADFKERPLEWHHFGIENITVDERGVLIRPSQDAVEAAVWNFPALHRGRVTLELEAAGLAGPLTLLLTDHFSTPFDDADWLDCVFEVPVAPKGGPAKVELDFDCETGLLRAACDGQTAELRAWKRPRQGVNYLRVKTPRFAGDAGWLRLTAARVEETGI